MFFFWPVARVQVQQVSACCLVWERQLVGTDAIQVGGMTFLGGVAASRNLDCNLGARAVYLFSCDQNKDCRAPFQAFPDRQACILNNIEYIAG